MIRLSRPREPRPVALGFGVTVTLKPLSFAVYRAAIHSAERRAREMATEVGLIEAAGGSVAIVGASGCGKTTLLKLLASLLQPTQGEILVDAEPLARIGIERYRSMIGVVMQDDQLFAGSIADNISFFQSARTLIASWSVASWRPCTMTFSPCRWATGP